MPNDRAIGISGLAALVYAFVVLAASVALAQSRTIIYKSVPSTEELAHELFGVPIPARQPKFRTRGLRPQGELEEAEPVEKAEVQVHWSANEESVDAPLKKYAFNIQFQFDSTTILPESRPFLDALGEVLRVNSDIDQPLSIVGHTDASGSAEYNLQLSMARAAAVRDYLETKWKVNAERLNIDGRGESELLSSIDPYSSTNRRVEFWTVEQPSN